jgi:hypothetical protein
LLTKLPLLFTPTTVTSSPVLNDMRQKVQKQTRLVRRVFVGALALCALSCLPELSGAGPLLSWAAQAWPDVFEPVVHLVEQPITNEELVGGAAIVTIFSLACLRELAGLRRFEGDLLEVLPRSPVHDAIQRMGTRSPAVAAYLVRVSQVRDLRLGDWRIARQLIGAKVS